ncbi:hypothetical protein [Gordonia sp. NPDC003376]
MAEFIHTTSAVMPVRLRQDIARPAAQEYWRGTHRDIVRRLPLILEYNQHHFSTSDRGFWPATTGVGTLIPSDWELDGIAETRFPGALGAVRVPRHMGEVFRDEQNVFEHVIGLMTGSGGGRWWTTGLDEDISTRTVLFLRRRRLTRSREFRSFVHERLGPALYRAGARDLRTYGFLRWSPYLHPTPGVSHRHPSYRAYNGAVVFGADDRDHLQEIIHSDELAPVVAEQSSYVTGVHAFGVEQTVPGIRISERSAR